MLVCWQRKKRYETVILKILEKDKDNMVNRRTVLLADANEEFRGMLRDAIEKTEEFTVVGSAGDGTEALQMLDQLKPGTAMLVKASHAMHFSTLVDQLRGLYD